MKKAIVLLSGGLDSSTTLYYAKSRGYDCRALIFEYGQKHSRELKSAAAIARLTKTPYRIMKIKLPWGGSALISKRRQCALSPFVGKKGIPPTYVPARNTIFISFALSYAEAIGADAIFIGANAIDYSGYPDCRPEYYKALQVLIKKGLRDRHIKIVTPLIKMTKAQIIKLARKLDVPLEITWSCYKGGKKPCGTCDSCRLRDKGFAEAGLTNI